MLVVSLGFGINAPQGVLNSRLWFARSSWCMSSSFEEMNGASATKALRPVEEWERLMDAVSKR